MRIHCYIAVFMAWSGVGGLKPNPKAITFMHEGPGFPVYFIQFVSVAKILGGIILLIPGLRTIKEWAYAGMFFDLAGDFYSVNANAGKFDPSSLFIVFTALIGAASYYFWKKTA